MNSRVSRPVPATTGLAVASRRGRARSGTPRADASSPRQRPREREFVDAARSLGARGHYILFRELLPSLVAPILVYATLLIPVNILFEAALSYLIHIAIGLAFVVLAGIHLAQRRRTSIALARRLPRPRLLNRRTGRLALADFLLPVITAVMFASGMWDWLSGHPTRIRWHALTGIALAVFLLLHTVRRRSRLRASRIR